MSFNFSQNFQKWFPQCFERSLSEFEAALQIFICSDVQGNFRSVEVSRWLCLPRPKVLAIVTSRIKNFVLCNRPFSPENLGEVT